MPSWTKKKKRKKSISPLKALHNRLERLCRDYVKIRSNGLCEVCLDKGIERQGTEVDHCFSRSYGELKYDVRNLTNLCSYHHGTKTTKEHGSDVAVNRVVVKREGWYWFEWAEAIVKSKKPSTLTIVDLEHCENIVRAKIETMKENL